MRAAQVCLLKFLLGKKKLCSSMRRQVVAKFLLSEAFQKSLLKKRSLKVYLTQIVYSISFFKQ